MSPRTRDALILVKGVLDRWDVALALFCLQLGSALMVTFSSWGWLAIPFYGLAALDGYKFIRRFSR